jgi:predicted DNA-binding transcriptional regulator AlpA
MDSDDILITAPQLRKRYGGKSDMWLWRQLKNDSSFPRPLYLNGRRHWRFSQVQAWESQQSTREAA